MFRLALNYNTIKLLSLGLSVVVEMELSDAWEIVIAQMKKQYCCRRGKNKKVSCLWQPRTSPCRRPNSKIDPGHYQTILCAFGNFKSYIYMSTANYQNSILLPSKFQNLHIKSCLAWLEENLLISHMNHTRTFTNHVCTKEGGGGCILGTRVLDQKLSGRRSKLSKICERNLCPSLKQRSQASKTLNLLLNFIRNVLW